jgi:hypothetical protein
MIPASITLHSASNRLTAQLAGTYVTSIFRQPSGKAIPPGNYILSAPMHNSVYGTFALLSPTREASPQGMLWIDLWIDIPVAASGKDWVSSRESADWVTTRESADWVTTRESAGWIDLPSVVNQPGVFVLLERPLAGRNTILITAGFAELTAALHQAGGATVTVA